MAAANIITSGSADATSSDVVVAAGTPITVALKDITGRPRVMIKLKDDLGVYNIVGQMHIFNRSVSIATPGTYQFVRVAQTGATCGVYSA